MATVYPGADLSARDIVDLKRYPIELLTSPEAQLLIEDCQAKIAQTGACELKNFVTPAGLEALIADAVRLEGTAFHNALVGNAYLDTPDESLPPDHVRRATEPTSLGAVAYDQFPTDSALRKVFEWDPVMHFIGKVLELPKIYRYGDPMGALNLAVMKDGDYLRWHFDQTDFVSSLAIRSAEEGGRFEYVPMIRNSREENYEKVKALLAGSREGVIEIANAPGTLVLFKGRHSIHRVTPIHGKISRLMGLFGFDTQPGVVSTEHLRRIRYGRTEVLNTL